MKFKTSSWMIIDLDHIFRRHYIGLKNYYVKNNPDKYDFKTYEWYKNHDFVLELSKQIKNKITNLVTINRYIPNNHVILTNDMIESKTTDWMWRAEIFPDWIKKYTQEYYSYRMDPIWKAVFDISLNKFFQERGYIHFCQVDTEADDIIAVIVKLIEKTFPNDTITIISQDSDFYQLINDKITVLNINGEEETYRILPSGEINLWFKIINGQKSNHVPPLEFNIEFLKEYLGNDFDLECDEKNDTCEDEKYRELTKKELYVILHNLNDFQQAINKNENNVKHNQHLINQKIIDFSYIPKELILTIEKKFWSFYKNIQNYQSNLTSSEQYYKSVVHKKKDTKHTNIFSCLKIDDDDDDVNNDDDGNNDDGNEQYQEDEDNSSEQEIYEK